MSSNTEPNLLIVIVNYFMADDCCKLIESIFEFAPASLGKLICVDNSCDIGQWSQLEQLEKTINDKVLLIQKNVENKGFGAAINAVVEHQFTHDDSLQQVLLINPDVELNKDSINKLLEGSKQCIDAGIWGGVTVNASGNADGFHAWREPTLLREIAWGSALTKVFPIDMLVSDYRNKHDRQASLAHYSVDAISGCFLLINRSLWQELQGFDERFFLYSEEIDLCYRARKKGANPQVINGVIFKHARGTASYDLKRMKMLLNSKLLYWQKHHGVLKKHLVQMIYAFAFCWRGLMFLCIPKRRKQAKNWLILSNILFLNKSLVTAQ